MREKQKFFKVGEKSEFCKKSGKILVFVKVGEKSEFCLRKWFRNLLKEMHLLQRLQQKTKWICCIQNPLKNVKIENEEKNVDGLQKKLQQM